MQNNIDSFVSQFQNKNQKAFNKLYNIYNKSVYGIIYKIVKDNAIAEDLLQDTFIKAWQNSESYSPEKGRFFTWILNIAHNTAIDKVRSKTYKESRSNFDTDNFYNSISSNDCLDKQTNSIGINKYVSKLSPKGLKVVNLIYFKGFTQKQTSEHLNIPLGTVKTRNRNCINKLRAMML